MAHILIVDDIEANRYLLSTLLSGYGHRVEVASQGVEALAQARAAPPDMVISDLLMPVMDGYTLLTQWKQDPVLSRIPFVVYTATYTGVQDERLALDLGADAFIVKPCEPEELITRLEGIEAHRAARPANWPNLPSGAPQVLQQTYNEVLVRKLEDKAYELEQANRALQHELGERKRIEAALRKSEQAARNSEHEQRQLAAQLEQERVRLAAAQSVAKVGSWETDLASGIVTWSDETRRIFECSPDEQVFTHELFLELVHPQDRASVNAAFEGSLVNPGESVHAHRIVVPDGRIKFVEERWRIITDDVGQPVRALGTCQDITTRHNLEEGLRQRQRLESIGQLTGGVAHDFNNLLTVILGNAELLVEQLHGSPMSRVADLVVSAAQRGADLTKRLLVFARKQVLEPRSTDVAAVVHGLVELLRPTLAAGIEIEVEAAPGLWRAWVDGAQLEHALLNLCFNARDAMPQGGQLKISLANFVRTAPPVSAIFDAFQAADLVAGEYVCLSVSDTGNGVAAEHLVHVFEPFFTTKEKGKGTGLGLSMVYGFALQSGGQVSIESEPGQGTRVLLHLPRARQPADTEQTQESNPELLGGNEAILLVEDDELVRSFARAQLSALGYRVTVADSGEHALELIAQPDAFDLLFTDMAMPGMNGSQLAVAARALRPEMRVLFTSGYASEAMASGGGVPVPSVPDAQLLRKPYRRMELARKLRAVLEKDIEP